MATGNIVPVNELSAFRVCSLNHRTCGLPGLAEVSAGADGAAMMHQILTSKGIASAVLATCNRTELYWRSQSEDDDYVAMLALASAVKAPIEIVRERSVTLSGADAAAHLFRVCSGLESLVLGEAEILGQVRTAMEMCTGAGPFVTGVFRAAIRTGRAARAETAIGMGALSVASTAVQWLSERVKLADHRVMIIGAGTTGEKAARPLSRVGTGALVVANRTISQAEALAARVGGSAIGLDAMPDELDGVDAVISAVNAPGWVLTLDQIRRRAARCSKPLVVVDLSMPPSVEPGECEGLVRVDLVTLEESTRAHRKQREGETPRVEAVIARELGFLQKWAHHESQRPLMSTRSRARAGVASDEGSAA